MGTLDMGSGPSSEEHAILRAIVYASLFDYPLTLRQTRETLVGSLQTEPEVLARYRASAWLQEAVEYREGLFFLRGRSDLIAERRRREGNTRHFLRQHHALLDVICGLPYVRLVALSGSVAHGNLVADGDLDLFVVTSPSRVWSVTVAIILLAKFANRRRITCVNYVLSEDRLRVEQEDLFTASQIVSLKPLTGADVYVRFVGANPFVAACYPNFVARGRMDPERAEASRVRRVVERVLSLGPAPALEWVCRRAYGAYLRRRSSRWASPDQVRLDPQCLKLHTNSHRQSVMQRFDAALADVEARRGTPAAVGL
jgi:predicted nucleotidyltransferase